MLRALSQAEALAIRAGVAVYGERPETGRDLADRALGIDAAQPLALEVKGVYFFLRNRPDEARTWLKTAVDHPSASFRAHYYYAVLNVSTPLVAETHLKRALALKPGFQPAVERLRSFPKLHETLCLC
jgi:Tfp pilus assembly protein PilF